MREEPDVPGIDSRVDADLECPNGVTGRFSATYLEPEMYFRLRLNRTRGEALVHNFRSSGFDEGITITRDGIVHVEGLGSRTSYTYQFEAFANLARKGTPVPTDADDAVVQADFIDSCYTAAGLPLRPTAVLR
jgi:predicted dehydrogenase